MCEQGVFDMRRWPESGLAPVERRGCCLAPKMLV